MNNKKIINAVGLPCPKPLILTKKQLDSSNAEPFIVIVDNLTAKNNIERFLTDKKIIFTTSHKPNTFNIFIHRMKISTDIDIRDNALINNKPNTIICIKSLSMGGVGDNELGEILLKAFISTIKETSPLPSAIIFYNSAVKLTEKKSSVASELETLAGRGIKLIICGTCTEYYKISETIDIAIISNMYEIMTILNLSDKIIYP